MAQTKYTANDDLRTTSGDTPSFSSSDSLGDSSFDSSGDSSLVRRIPLFLAVLGGTLWLGGSVVRAAVCFDLFVPGSLAVKPDMPLMAQAQILRLFTQTALYTLVGYAFLLVFGGVWWISSRRLWRKRGGIFMGGALVALYIPVEFWQIYYDAQLIQMAREASFSFADFPLQEAQDLLVRRLTVLGGAGPFLAALAYLSALYCFVAQPMTLRRSRSLKSGE
jgi:hypothetical protein